MTLPQHAICAYCVVGIPTHCLRLYIRSHLLVHLWLIRHRPLPPFLSAVKLRLTSVTNIQKITKSMKMVSAAKFARAERQLRAGKVGGHTLSWHA